MQETHRSNALSETDLRRRLEFRDAALLANVLMEIEGPKTRGDQHGRWMPFVFREFTLGS
jgi:hypothetical protein